MIEISPLRLKHGEIVSEGGRGKAGSLRESDFTQCLIKLVGVMEESNKPSRIGTKASGEEILPGARMKRQVNLPLCWHNSTPGKEAVCDTNLGQVIHIGKVVSDWGPAQLLLSSISMFVEAHTMERAGVVASHRIERIVRRNPSLSHEEGSLPRVYGKTQQSLWNLARQPKV